MKTEWRSRFYGDCQKDTGPWTAAVFPWGRSIRRIVLTPENPNMIFSPDLSISEIRRGLRASGCFTALIFRCNGVILPGYG